METDKYMDAATAVNAAELGGGATAPGAGVAGNTNSSQVSVRCCYKTMIYRIICLSHIAAYSAQFFLPSLCHSLLYTLNSIFLCSIVVNLGAHWVNIEQRLSKTSFDWYLFDNLRHHPRRKNKKMKIIFRLPQFCWWRWKQNPHRQRILRLCSELSSQLCVMMMMIKSAIVQVMQLLWIVSEIALSFQANQPPTSSTHNEVIVVANSAVFLYIIKCVVLLLFPPPPFSESESVQIAGRQRHPVIHLLLCTELSWWWWWLWFIISIVSKARRATFIN